MAEGTYEYECMRAELLGIEKPNYDEFVKKMKEQAKTQVEEEDVDLEHLKEIDLETEGVTRLSGRLDELNNILKKTQSKISRMKASCGSVAGLLRNRLGSFSSQSSLDKEQVEEREEPEGTEKVNEYDKVGTSSPEEVTTPETPMPSVNGTSGRKSDLQKALDKDLSVLDAMIEKAEHAQYSMSHQTKQMKKFI